MHVGTQATTCGLKDARAVASALYVRRYVERCAESHQNMYSALAAPRRRNERRSTEAARKMRFYPHMSTTAD